MITKETFKDKTLTCLECGIKATRTGANQKFCSKRCMNRCAWRNFRANASLGVAAAERQRNKERRTRHKHSINSRFQVYKRSAKLSGLIFQLTKELLAEFSATTCFYCGLTTGINGVDRVDSSKGYTDGNMVSCCKYCNRAKSDLTQDEFYTLCARVYQLHTVPAKS